VTLHDAIPIRDDGIPPKRQSIRLRDYNYTQTGAYFITICTHNHLCLFGDIAADKVHLTAVGEMVAQCWQDIPVHFPHVALQEFVVMPNHVHGIISIVEAPHAVPAPVQEQFSKPVAGSIPTIIRSYKSAVTKTVKKLNETPSGSLWQRNYYEHVIRNEADYTRIAEYIIDNPFVGRRILYIPRLRHAINPQRVTGSRCAINGQCTTDP
jgi:putative transposase